MKAAVCASFGNDQVSVIRENRVDIVSYSITSDWIQSIPVSVFHVTIAWLAAADNTAPKPAEEQRTTDTEPRRHQPNSESMCEARRNDNSRLQKTAPRNVSCCQHTATAEKAVEHFGNVQIEQTPGR